MIIQITSMMIITITHDFYVIHDLTKTSNFSVWLVDRTLLLSSSVLPVLLQVLYIPPPHHHHHHHHHHRNFLFVLIIIVAVLLRPPCPRPGLHHHHNIFIIIIFIPSPPLPPPPPCNPHSHHLFSTLIHLLLNNNHFFAIFRVPSPHPGFPSSSSFTSLFSYFSSPSSSPSSLLLSSTVLSLNLHNLIATTLSSGPPPISGKSPPQAWPPIRTSDNLNRLNKIFIFVFSFVCFDIAPLSKHLKNRCKHSCYLETHSRRTLPPTAANQCTVQLIILRYQFTPYIGMYPYTLRDYKQNMIC